MRNRIIGLFVYFFVGTITLISVKSLVDAIESKYQMNTQEMYQKSEADIIREMVMAEYEDAKNQLAIEVNNYISSVAPKANIDAHLMVDLCTEYGVDIIFVMAQGQVESHFATRGTAAKTLSIFNVGAYDGHSASRQCRNGFGFSDPNESIEPFLRLVTNEYMINGKTEKDLMNNYVNGLGKRYASNPKYESMLRSVYKRISSHPDFNVAYENFLELQSNLDLC